MAASMKDANNGTADEKETATDASVHPSVNFLYKTMLQRDPHKRRVKPVADNLVQINFGGLGDEDSEEDSDFDIGQQSNDSAAMDSQEEDENEESVDSDESREGMEESHDASRDQDIGGEDDSMTWKTKKRGEAPGYEKEDEKEKENSKNESDSEHKDDEMEETSDEFETDEDDSDEDVDDEDNDDVDEDEEEEDSENSKSPEIKGLGQVLDMIDSDDDDEDYVPKKKKKKSAVASAQAPPPVQKKSKVKAKKVTKSEKTNVLASVETSTKEGVVKTTPQARIKVIVCCVCLSDRSGDDDEIVECDNCGIAVHEGCYGISESHSNASTVSSASTEPWFCDACKANNAEPVCELCPNSGGIFKETDNGKWVHIVCALYTPGVAFGDVDRLSLVTLFEMPYSKWGARECSLCEDSRFGQTGVCINCDAGMCKAYFHVTCAQREGLLAEVTPEEVMDVADPFFAYCKLHADKMTSKIKRRNWLAIQSHVKSHKPSAVDGGAEKLRFQRKLQHHRNKYGAAKLRKPPSFVPAQKMVRHLHTSPSAVRSFLKKAEMMGVVTHTVPQESQEIRKKAQGQPAFTGDFITYYMERNLKIENLKTLSKDLSSQNKTLQNQEGIVRRKYDKLAETVKELQVKGTSLRKEGESLCGMLQNIYGKDLFTYKRSPSVLEGVFVGNSLRDILVKGFEHEYAVDRPVPNIPEIFKTKKRTRSPSKKETAAPDTDSVFFHQCGICNKTKQQHLMAKCDSCKKHFHLGCLNPPLTRMPKKTKLFGWQCSICALSSSDGSVKSAPNPHQPRKLRETIKEPDKFFHLSHVQASLDSQRKKSMLNRKSKARRQTAQARRAHRQKQLRKNSANEGSNRKPSSGSPVKTKGKKSISPKKSPGDACSTAEASLTPSPSKRSAMKSPGKGDSLKPAETVPLDIMCVVCNGSGTRTDTIRCDECKLFYHLACLDPPMKKSPKVRGYVWHCEACDMDESSEEDAPRRKKVKGENKQQEGKKSPITLASGREGREASSSIMFDIDVSSDD